MTRFHHWPKPAQLLNSSFSHILKIMTNYSSFVKYLSRSAPARVNVVDRRYSFWAFLAYWALRLSQYRWHSHPIHTLMAGANLLGTKPSHRRRRPIHTVTVQAGNQEQFGIIRPSQKTGHWNGEVVGGCPPGDKPVLSEGTTYSYTLTQGPWAGVEVQVVGLLSREETCPSEQTSPPCASTLWKQSMVKRPDLETPTCGLEEPRIEPQIWTASQR